MLLPSDKDYLAHKEKYQDLIRRADKARLIGDISPENRVDHEIYRKFLNHLGTTMIKLGEKLEHHSLPSSQKPA